MRILKKIVNSVCLIDNWLMDIIFDPSEQRPSGVKC